jgi:hypothetical protein
MEFRIWVWVDANGCFVPTEFYARATKFEHAERDINKKISELGKPCIIVISKFNPKNNES